MQILDQLPGWFKAFAASLWVVFVCAPLLVWLSHHFGEATIWSALPLQSAAFYLFYARSADEDLSEAEYYRRKAQDLCAADL